MNIIYCVYTPVEYEGDTEYGFYTTKEKALEAQKYFQSKWPNECIEIAEIKLDLPLI